MLAEIQVPFLVTYEREKAELTLRKQKPDWEHDCD